MEEEGWRREEVEREEERDRGESRRTREKEGRTGHRGEGARLGVWRSEIDTEGVKQREQKKSRGKRGAEDPLLSGPVPWALCPAPLPPRSLLSSSIAPYPDTWAAGFSADPVFEPQDCVLGAPSILAIHSGLGPLSRHFSVLLPQNTPMPVTHHGWEHRSLCCHVPSLELQRGLTRPLSGGSSLRRHLSLLQDSSSSLKKKI